MTPKTRASEAAQNVEEVIHQGAELTQGRIPNTDGNVAMGHPIHPSTVHWPIAFLTAHFGINSLKLLPISLQPTSLVPSILPPAATFPALAHYTAVAGVVLALPAIATGFGEAYEMARVQYQNKGTWTKVLDDAWNMRDIAGEKLKTTITHASMNDIVVGIAGYNAYRGWRYPNLPLPQFSTFASALAFPLLLYSAYLGGKLVYEYGVGVQRQGAGKEVKEKMQ